MGDRRGARPVATGAVLLLSLVVCVHGGGVVHVSDPHAYCAMKGYDPSAAENGGLGPSSCTRCLTKPVLLSSSVNLKCMYSAREAVVVELSKPSGPTELETNDQGFSTPSTIRTRCVPYERSDFMNEWAPRPAGSGAPLHVGSAAVYPESLVPTPDDAKQYVDSNHFQIQPDGRDERLARTEAVCALFEQSLPRADGVSCDNRDAWAQNLGVDRWPGSPLTTERWYRCSEREKVQVEARLGQEGEKISHAVTVLKIGKDIDFYHGTSYATKAAKVFAGKGGGYLGSRSTARLYASKDSEGQVFRFRPRTTLNLLDLNNLSTVVMIRDLLCDLTITDMTREQVIEMRREDKARLLAEYPFFPFLIEDKDLERSPDDEPICNNLVFSLMQMIDLNAPMVPDRSIYQWAQKHGRKWPYLMPPLYDDAMFAGLWKRTSDYRVDSNIFNALCQQISKNKMKLHGYAMPGQLFFTDPSRLSEDAGHHLPVVDHAMRGEIMVCDPRVHLNGMSIDEGYHPKELESPPQ